VRFGRDCNLGSEEGGLVGLGCPRQAKPGDGRNLLKWVVGEGNGVYSCLILLQLFGFTSSACQIGRIHVSKQPHNPSLSNLYTSCAVRIAKCTWSAAHTIPQSYISHFHGCYCLVITAMKALANLRRDRDFKRLSWDQFTKLSDISSRLGVLLGAWQGSEALCNAREIQHLRRRDIAQGLILSPWWLRGANSYKRWPRASDNLFSLTNKQTNKQITTPKQFLSPSNNNRAEDLWHSQNLYVPFSKDGAFWRRSQQRVWASTANVSKPRPTKKISKATQSIKAVTKLAKPKLPKVSTSDKKPSYPRCILLGLPLELREKVFKFCMFIEPGIQIASPQQIRSGLGNLGLGSESGKIISKSWVVNRKGGASSQLLLCCKEICDQGIEILYGTNVFTSTYMVNFGLFYDLLS